MTWNYRIMRRKHPDDKTVDYGVYEVFYDEKGKIEGWTEEMICPTGETLKELIDDFKLYKQAFSRPILDYETGLEVSDEEKP